MGAVSTPTWKKIDFVGKYKAVHFRFDYGDANDSLTVKTGLYKIISYSVSPSSVSAKPILHATVSGGTITVNVTDPTEPCYAYVTVWGW